MSYTVTIEGQQYNSYRDAEQALIDGMKAFMKENILKSEVYGRAVIVTLKDGRSMPIIHAAKALGVSATHIHNHLYGRKPSKKEEPANAE